MSSRPWRVESRRASYRGKTGNWVWRASVSTQASAREVARLDSGRYGRGDHVYRMLNRDTAEVIHLD